MFSFNDSSFAAIRRLFHLFLLITLSGCGLAVEGAGRLSAINFPPGKLYTEDFYQTATPDDVRKAIGSSSLEGKYYEKRTYEGSGRGGYNRVVAMPGTLEAAAGVIDLFIPMTSPVINSERVFPLDLAQKHSPYPEVILILVESGARIWSFDAASPKFEDDLIERLILIGNKEQLCYLIPSLVRRENKDLLKLCFERASRTERFNYNINKAMEHAVRGGKVSMIRMLIEQGADTKAFMSEYVIRQAISARHFESIQFLTGLRADEPYPPSLFAFALKNDADDTTLRLLADTVTLVPDTKFLEYVRRNHKGNTDTRWKAEAYPLQAACDVGRLDLVARLLRRGMGMPPEESITLAPETPNREKLASLLLRYGIQVEEH